MTSSRIPSHFAELLDCPSRRARVGEGSAGPLSVGQSSLPRSVLARSPAADRTSAAVESILGKTDYDLSPAFLADQFRHDDEQVLAGHRIVNRLERVGESRGTTVWNITDKIPVVDAKGAIIGTAGITRAAGPASSLEATAPGFGPALAHMRAHFHHEITNRQPRVPLEHVAPRVRAAVPGRLPSHPAAIPAKAPAAHRESRPDLHGRHRCPTSP